MRYASLHRAAEKGLDADETWAELAQVCVELGLHDEAVRSYEKIKTPADRVRIHNLLVRQRLIEKQETQLHEVGEEYTRGRLVDDVQEAVHFLAQDHMPMTVTVATAMFPLVIGIGGYMTSGSSFFLLPMIAMLPAVLVLMAVGALARRVLMDSALGIEDAPVL